MGDRARMEKIEKALERVLEGFLHKTGLGFLRCGQAQSATAKYTGTQVVGVAGGKANAVSAQRSFGTVDREAVVAPGIFVILGQRSGKGHCGAGVAGFGTGSLNRHRLTFFNLIDES